jgi:hypothetical protein
MNNIGTVSFGAAVGAELKLPDGRSVRSVPHTELYTALAKLGIPGFAHTNGLERNIEAYAEHLAGIADVAGRAAVSKWLGEKLGV